MLLEDLLGPDPTLAQQMEGSIKTEHIAYDIKTPNTGSRFAGPSKFCIHRRASRGPNDQRTLIGVLKCGMHGERSLRSISQILKI